MFVVSVDGSYSSKSMTNVACMIVSFFLGTVHCTHRSSLTKPLSVFRVYRNLR